MKSKPTISRRTLLKSGSAALGGTLLGGLAAPALAQTSDELTVMIAQPHVGGAKIAAATFEEKTGVKVNIDVIPLGQVYQQVALDQQSGANRYDVFQCWYCTIGAVAANGLGQDITDLIERDKAEIQPDDYIQNVYNPYSLYNGRRFGLPFDGDSHALYYNKEIFERLGEKPPTTWTELNAISARVTEQLKGDGVHGHSLIGLPVPLLNVSTFANRVANFGAEFLDADGNPTLDTPEMLAAAQSIAELAPNASPTPPEVGYTEGLALFLSGKAAMTEGWMDLGINAQQDADSKIKDQWGVLPLPTLDGDASKSRAALNAGWSLCLSSKTEKEELAWEFLKWASGVEMAETMIATNGTGIDPFRRSAVNSEAYVTANAQSQPIVSVALENAMSWPTVPDAPQLLEILSRDLASMLAGNKSPEDTMKGVQRAWDRILG
ncbi:ABC transporter substrate-binding protein [Pacificoceanicola onchidii]|uniref:ABC transporter substrate-binding protein n=1 Tax=Pacificoceanicola onchidii TaxID=2562685 RepID=UPI001F1041C7|nr:sugar ABC transporter substrate-binding protein [Pacificoceanicola onchidii]